MMCEVLRKATGKHKLIEGYSTEEHERSNEAGSQNQ